MRPSIDHSLLSPSGRMSQRARKSASDREAAKLFAGCDLRPKEPEPPTERERLLREAKQCRDLAAGGMRPRAFIKQAESCERRAADLARTEASQTAALDALHAVDFWIEASEADEDVRTDKEIRLALWLKVRAAITTMRAELERRHG